MGDANLLERILDRAEDVRDLPLALLKDITNDFSKERKIGQGGFGEVYKGVLGDRIVAVKRIHINVHTFDDKLFHREVTILIKINHPNVIRFLGFCSHEYQKLIEEEASGRLIFPNVLEKLLCFEYISNGSLDKHITDELRGLEWEKRYEIITGICRGLRYLHKEKIIHMDLKPQNILLDHQDGKYMVPKITDFGLSRSNENSSTVGPCFGTLAYLAPEYREESKTTSACDVYSLGLIIIELVTGCKDIPDENNVLRRWRHRWKKPPTQLQYQQVNRCIYIAKRCREQKPEARPSISKIISCLRDSETTYGQISPCFNEDDMLGVKPLQLRLPSELKNEISCSLELTNDTLNCIAFNIQPPSAKYVAQPVKGIVQPKSKCGVKITVQPRDRDHADKFIVQSMQVEASEGLREEDITERMSRAEDGKVDEVDLIVVYEPMKLQENCKHREDTNMPAEEAPQAEQREIVESTSGKGKLGSHSSENAETASTDINSSARGQCAEQIEQCNLHSLQSFSRHYPTNLTYLKKESDRAVDLARGAMGSLLDKLGKLVTEDYNLKESIKRDIESFSKDLRKMHQDLPKLENADEAKVWVDEVRELSYHIEDMVDSFLVHVEPDSNKSGFRELTHAGLNLLVNGMPTHNQIDDVIRDIKNKVQAVADRKETFDVNNVVPYAIAKAYIDDLRDLAIYEDKEELIGIEARRNELIRLFEEDGDVSQQNLKIVSIVGLGGLGKTTLAKAVYDKLQAQYHTRAFVPVGRNPDVKEVLKNIISELEKDFHLENLNVRQLINKLREFLQNKRYFIVIDDLWDSEASAPSQKEAWPFIKCAFPRNKYGSRVITTTRNHDVALACCNAESKYIYRIKPLSGEESRRLFLRRTFGSEKDCPDTMPKENISIDILKKCGGMPLAINSIASLLAGKPETTWEYVRKSLGAPTEGNAALDNMKQILDLSYIHLPDHLKTCLMYVCMYPEDREIDKNDLLRQWIAEGFVHVSTNSMVDAEDVAENYFKTLINMCMIQPGKIDYNDEVLSCRVHDIIFDLMRSKSSQVNFVHVIDGLKDETGACGKIRRASVHSNDEKDMRIFETMKNKDPLKHVRSVLLYRRLLVPYFLEFNYVRVLHLEYEGFCGSLLDLTGISRLFHLRYLKIASSGRTYADLKLPDQIGELQQLETIDLQRCYMVNYPSDIVSLPRLSHLRYDGAAGVALPDGIGRMKSLRTLGGVCLVTSSVDTIKGLGELTNLRNLEIRSSFMVVTIEKVEVRMEALQASISRINTSLRILSIRMPISVMLSRTLFPQGSHIRKLDLRGPIVHRCPEWIGQLQYLYSFCIMVREVANGVSIVAGLPSLAYFCLIIDSYVRGEVKEGRVRFSGSGSFRALKHLRFRCQKVSLTFEEGALPKLETLEILFRHRMARRFLPVGIEHLPGGTLKKISLSVPEKDWCSSSAEFRLYQSRDKLIEHKKKLRPVLKRAFKVHHPGADIAVHFEGFVDENYDDVEDAHGVNDEGDYEEEDNVDEEYDDVEDATVPLEQPPPWAKLSAKLSTVRARRCALTGAQGPPPTVRLAATIPPRAPAGVPAQQLRPATQRSSATRQARPHQQVTHCPRLSGRRWRSSPACTFYLQVRPSRKEIPCSAAAHELMRSLWTRARPLPRVRANDEGDYEEEEDYEGDGNEEDDKDVDDEKVYYSGEYYYYGEEDYYREENYHSGEDDEGVDDEEADSGEEYDDDVDDNEHDEGSYQVNGSQTSAQVQANTRQPELIEAPPSCSSLDKAEPVVNFPVDINNDLFVGKNLDLNQAPPSGLVGIAASVAAVQPQAKAVDDEPSDCAFWDNLVTDSDEGAEDKDDANQDVFWDNLVTDDEGEASVGQA